MDNNYEFLNNKDTIVPENTSMHNDSLNAEVLSSFKDLPNSKMNDYQPGRMTMLPMNNTPRLG